MKMPPLSNTAVIILFASLISGVAPAASAASAKSDVSFTASIVPFDAGVFPDAVSFDASGAVANASKQVRPDGTAEADAGGSGRKAGSLAGMPATEMGKGFAKTEAQASRSGFGKGVAKSKVTFSFFDTSGAILPTRFFLKLDYSIKTSIQSSQGEYANAVGTIDIDFKNPLFGSIKLDRDTLGTVSQSWLMSFGSANAPRQVDITAYSMSVAAVPTPLAALLLSTALGSLALLGRRRARG